ncbi:MAG TPA: exosortase/archaeosortase family protein [Verrucomicrobiae bacterium]|jgi:exosortase|nr:exosortase/archaeosortase family protein [Verrucomicrobiae bacterium]
MDKKDNTVAPAPSFLEELTDSWHQLPNKSLFFPLLLVWLLVFQFYGNATFGYINSASLLYWMWFTYNNPMAHGEDGHGNLIPFLVLGLFWMKRKELLVLPNRAWWPGVFMLAGAVLLHMASYVIQQPKLSIVAMFGGIYALMGMAWGPQWLRKSVFPFFLFMFSIPISSSGESITVPLRLAVSKIVQVISQNILGLDVQREGNLLFNAAHTYSYEVAAACSGLQSLLAIFALATIYAFLYLDKSWKRVLMIAMALPLAMLSNVVRLMCVIVAAELYGQKGGNYVHDNFFFSMLPYVPAIIGVMFLGRWLQGNEPQEPTDLTPRTA